MCGIAGFLGGYEPEVARRMGRRIAHRGPDDEGLFVDRDAGVALAHRRLAILDPSAAGHQPMTSRCGRFVICYNGEIYNFPDLKRELEGRGISFRSNCDTEALVELFALDGTASFARLNGIFAISIWDKHERTLFLARDGVGVKPLYICSTASGFAFASEIKALLELPDLDRQIDRVAAVSYLTYLWSPGERTMFRSVTKLSPGQWMSLSSSGQRAEGRFYSLPAPAPLHGATEAELVNGTREAIRTAVHRQMLADVDVGAFLSGGLDSTAVVAFARECSEGRRLQCFTIAYDEQADEAGELVPDLPYARKAASHLGVDLHEVRANASMADQLERLVYVLDEPQPDPAALNSLLIAALARENGIKVLLSGTGGDDIFSGYRRHQAAGLEGLLSRVPRPLRRVLGMASRHLPVTNTPTRRLRKLFEQAGRTADERMAGYFEWFDAGSANELLAEPVEGGASRVREPLMAVLAAHPNEPPLERILRLDQHFFLTDHNLSYTDRTGMASGVEIRVPFLDPDLVEWAAQIPPGYKMKGRTTKYVFRKAMEGILPHDIIYRPKTGFGVPLRAWLRKGMRDRLEELLSERTVRARGLFNPAAVTLLKDQTLAGERDASYALLGLMMTEMWLRKFVDRPEDGSAGAASATDLAQPAPV
jgi:asparagine synthase (glutamine-hydrolysing)